MKYFNSKSQAPLEFLTTYWWVLIVIFLLIGALWYFGILGPSKILPDRCSIDPNLECKFYKLAETDAGTAIVRLKLTNNFPSSIVINNWDAISTQGTSLGCTIMPPVGIWLSKETRDVEFAGCNNDLAGFVFDQKAKTKIVLSYRPALADASFSKKIEGEVFATVTSVESLLGVPECNDDTDNDGDGCIDYDGGEAGTDCTSPSDPTESGSACAGGGALGGGPTEPLECFVSNFCEDTAVFKMSALADAHSEIPSETNFIYRACCRSATDTLTTDCSDSNPLDLSANSDAHVADGSLNYFGVPVCISANAGTISCRYDTLPCLATETCLATISSLTDAHAADCVTNPFNEKVCCKII